MTLQIEIISELLLGHNKPFKDAMFDHVHSACVTTVERRTERCRTVVCLYGKHGKALKSQSKNEKQHMITIFCHHQKLLFDNVRLFDFPPCPLCNVAADALTQVLKT